MGGRCAMKGGTRDGDGRVKKNRGKQKKETLVKKTNPVRTSTALSIKKKQWNQKGGAPILGKRKNLEARRRGGQIRRIYYREVTNQEEVKRKKESRERLREELRDVKTNSPRKPENNRGGGGDEVLKLRKNKQ